MEYNLWPTPKYLTAVTTTRQGGCSKPPYDSMNLAYHVGDDPSAVAKNRATLLTSLGLTPKRLVIAQQSHSDVIKKVTRADGGAGYESFESGIAADALYTYDTHLALAVFHADCVPVFLYDRAKKWVAIIHAGVPGTLKRITEKAANHLINHEGSRLEDIQAYIGPALSFAHAELDEQTKNEILSANPDFHYGIKKSDGRYYFDAALLNFGQLRKAGVPAENIVLSGLDTYEDSNRFYSAARDRITGRQMSIIVRNR